MSRHTLSRIDRVAQMSIQEEIIAKKKLELIEKQKTAELAKQVVAAQGNSSKPKKEKPATLHKPNVVLEPPSPKNNFNNDGSFFENFKKITDAAKKAQEDALPPPIVVPELVAEPTPEIENNDVLLLDDPTLAINSDITEVFISNFQQNAAAFCSAPPPPPPPPPSPPKPSPPSDQIHESDSSHNQNNTFRGGNNQSNDNFRNPNDFQQTFFDDCNDDEFHGNATSPSLSKLEQLQRPPPYQNSNFQESHSQQIARPMSNNNFPSNGARDFHNKFNKPNTNVPPPNFDNVKRFGGDQAFQKSSSPFEQSRFAQETAPKSFSPVGNSFANEQSRTGGNQMYSGGNNSNNSNNSNNNSNFMSNTNNNPFPINSNEYSDDETDDIPFNEPPPSNRFAPNQIQSSGHFPTPDQVPNQQHSNPFAQGGNRFAQNQNRFNQFSQDRGGNNVPPNRFTGNNRFVPDKPSPIVSPNPTYQNPFASNTIKPLPSVVPMLNTMLPFAQPPPITPNGSQQPPPSVAFSSAPPNFLNRPPLAFTQPIVNTATAPPPITTTALPPPPMFSQFPPLHTIPPPKPMSLNKIPPPRELDLNAIPEPTFDLDAIKVPDHSISRDHEFIPTSVESLVDLVAENGDEYEDKLRLRKIDMHSSLWFLCEKGSLAYRNYRKKVMEVRYNTTGSNNSQDDCSDKYDPAEMYDDYKDEDDEDAPVENLPTINSGGERYDAAKSKPSVDDDDNDYDSDAEFQSQSNKRNFEQMKRNLDNSHNRDYYASESDDDVNNDIENRDVDTDPAPRAVDIDMRILPQMIKKQKRSRWGEKEPNAVRPPVPPQLQPPMLAILPTSGKNNPFGGPKVMLTGVTRSDPALLQYARANYGTINLDEDEWRKCEDHYKVNLLYQDLLKKRNEIDRLASSGRFKYEYDSDEDVSGGTWEHKLRNAEMEATAVWSDALTKQAEGKHHIGDFLPPEELKKFMEKYESQQNNREPDISDYREYKLKEDNKGFQMLQKLGWKEGQGLGFGGSGILDPVNKAHQRDSNQGLGVTTSSGPDFGDNEYDAYRKRMMLAYRFRPNPLNNPRRAYY